MTKEVRHIIEHKRFERTWRDYTTYGEFLIPLLTMLFGLGLVVYAKGSKDYLAGISLMLVTFPLIKFLLLRLKQLNHFEEFNNKRMQQENFELCIKGLKNMKVVAIDRDIHNWTINARYKTFVRPPEWLTIVCLHNKVLVNTRPEPAFLLFWFRRNARIEFTKYV